MMGLLVKHKRDKSLKCFCPLSHTIKILVPKNMICQGPRVKVTKRQSVNTLMKCLKFDHGNLNSDMYVKRYAPGE